MMIWTNYSNIMQITYCSSCQAYIKFPSRACYFNVLTALSCIRSRSAVVYYWSCKHSYFTESLTIVSDYQLLYISVLYFEICIFIMWSAWDFQFHPLPTSFILSIIDGTLMSFLIVISKMLFQNTSINTS